MSDETDAIEAQLTALRSARANGMRAVQHGDERWEYKSDSEMANAIADLERRLDATSTTPRRRVRYFMQSSKGL